MICPQGRRRVAKHAVRIPGGSGCLGTGRPELTIDEEGPLRETRIKPFRIAATAVSNEEFSQFIAATGYVTEAERIGWSFVFWSDLPDGVSTTQAVAGAEWWRRVDGARWDRVDGATAADPSHPVVHISWNDARAYARWVGGRLPTEPEWEHAARGGLGDVRFSWGDREPDDRTHFPCNIWQGDFPNRNDALDGYSATAPVRSYEANGYGLYNMMGNVWEWTAEPFRLKSLKKSTRIRVAHMRGFKLLKGGSFLCHKSYCYRYRIAARTGSSPNSTTSHQGFRVVWDIGNSAD